MSDSHSIIPYVLAFITRTDGPREQVLLTFRSHTKFANNKHALIGGKIEMNETPHQAIVREMFEEIGIQVEPSDAHLTHILYFKGETRDCISFVFRVTQFKSEPYNKEPEKHGHVKWFDLSQLPSDLIERHVRIIEHLKKGVWYADEGF